MNDTAEYSLITLSCRFAEAETGTKGTERCCHYRQINLLPSVTLSRSIIPDFLFSNFQIVSVVIEKKVGKTLPKSGLGSLYVWRGGRETGHVLIVPVQLRGP